jgi:hypothetical protein
MKKLEARSLAKPKLPAQNYFPFLIAVVVVVCLSAGLALAFAGQTMSETQRWTLIGFLIAFSVFGLFFSLFGSAVSEWLVMREWRRISASEHEGKISWDILPPDEQRKKLTAEVENLARDLDIPQEQMSDLLSAYIVAEDLALRQVQQEENAPLLRHVSIGGSDFDSVLINQDTITCIDVTFLVKPELEQEKINLILKKVGNAKKIFSRLSPDSRLKLMLVLVTQLDDRGLTHLRSILGKNQFPATPVDVDIRFKDFEELQKIYAI